jgi:hypothetical protein
MSDVMRWRYGDTNPVVLPVDSGSVIEIGDLVWLDTDDAKPASAQADLGTEAQNQEGFHDKFAGVAMQRSRAGDTAPVRVATTGVFEFDTASATYEVGALVGLVGATTLGDQEVKAVATENLAVGRVARRLNPAGTKVLVDIVATVSRGGPQAMA